MATKRLTEKEISDTVKNYGFTFIKTYKDDKFHMVNVVCSEGHETTLRFNNFKNRKGSCSKCRENNLGKGNLKKSEEILSTLSKFGFSLLSNIEDYKGNRSKIEVECSLGHRMSTDIRMFELAKVKCRECDGKVKLDIESIREAFNLRNYTLLENEYINAITKMKYICKFHPNDPKSISLNSFQSGKGCKECANELLGELKKTPFHQVESDFAKREYNLISREYKNMNHYLEYICNKHENLGVQFVTYANLKVTQDNCSECRVENMNRGSRHGNWKGSMSNISEYLRKTLYLWRQDSIKENNGKCIITNKEFDEVHHLYSFNKIVVETFHSLSFKIHSTTSEHTPEELYQIQKKCIELHYHYGLGVCLTKEVHSLFHSIYGRYNNTAEQFEEFKIRFNSGEFDVNNKL